MPTQSFLGLLFVYSLLVLIAALVSIIDQPLIVMPNSTLKQDNMLKNSHHSCQTTIYLASRSPRRAELLQQIGLAFIVLPSDIDETPLLNEQSDAYVLRLAAEKAQACYDAIIAQSAVIYPVLAADTTVSIDGKILGKPQHDVDAFQMLSSMSGRCHEVHTGIAVATHEGVQVAISTTKVEMVKLSEEMIFAYIATGETRDKAGAYGIQGLASALIKRIEGSYSGVMGLPIFETAQLLGQAGIRIF
jgi:septum formation protein